MAHEKTFVPQQKLVYRDNHGEEDMFSTLVFWFGLGVVHAGTDISDKVLKGKPLGYGLGIMLGDPSGFSFAYRKSSSVIQAGVGYSVSEKRLHLLSDYLFHVKEIEINPSPRLYWALYTGVGGEVRIVDIPQAGVGPSAGLRIPFGAAFLSSDRPLDGFIEFSPVMRILPSTGFEFSVSMGGRYYFGKK